MAWGVNAALLRLHNRLSNLELLLKLSLVSSFCQIPIVDNEIKKETGELKPEDEVSAAPAQKLVTEMGTYVTQSALSSSRPSKKEEDR